VPTAFAGYSFHVAEAALVFANEVLVCFLLPLHAGLHRAYHLLTTVIHEGEGGVGWGGAMGGWFTEAVLAHMQSLAGLGVRLLVC
jgi:hypothetical protein